jgi:hypothetical protein
VVQRKELQQRSVRHGAKTLNCIDDTEQGQDGLQRSANLHYRTAGMTTPLTEEEVSQNQALVGAARHKKLYRAKSPSKNQLDIA